MKPDLTYDRRENGEHVTIIVYLWNDEREIRDIKRKTAIDAIIAMSIAFILSRVIQNFMPLRMRPLNSGDPAFVLPIGTETTAFEHWSSFPSDHAAILFAFSTIIWLYSARLGAFSFLSSIVFSCVARITQAITISVTFWRAPC